jgi:hypothetical protein
VDTGLLILRVVFGELIVGHGAQKLFRCSGGFGGHGLDGGAGFSTRWAFGPEGGWPPSPGSPRSAPEGAAWALRQALYRLFTGFRSSLAPRATLTTCSAGKYCRTRQQSSRSVSTRRSVPVGSSFRGQLSPCAVGHSKRIRLGRHQPL